MEIKMCIECKERPIYNKKRNLCAQCYQAWYRKNGLVKLAETTDNPQIQKRTQHDNEILFIKNYFTHPDWTYQPAKFKLGNGTTYTPDFYDPHRGEFIEVVGTRQAYHQGKEKYDLFRAKYPSVLLIIRKPDGEILNENENISDKWAGTPQYDERTSGVGRRPWRLS